MENLSSHTSLRVGGPATKFVNVATEEEIITALTEAGDEPGRRAGRAAVGEPARPGLPDRKSVV